MPKPAALPPELAVGPFATADARAVGISKGRLRASDLRSPHRGVRIAIEYEGSIHQTDARVFAEDIERRESLEDAGWLVIRVITGHVFGNPHWLTERVRRALRERADIAPAR